MWWKENKPFKYGITPAYALVIQNHFTALLDTAANPSFKKLLNSTIL
jgi:hypothetical protein